MPYLAAASGYIAESSDWDDRTARKRLFSRIRSERGAEPRAERTGSLFLRPEVPNPGRFAAISDSGMRRAAAAACVVAAIATGAYLLGGRIGGRKSQPAYQAAVVHPAGSQELASKKTLTEEIPDTRAAQISQLKKLASGEQQELARLRLALRSAEDQANQLSAADHESKEQLREVAEQRDKLAGQLRDAEQAYQNVQAELTSLRTERDRVVLRTASLESKIDEVTAVSRDQEHRLKDDEQYLASDRDIRELMGARKLYIADVFDVDSGSRTRKPFGRVFYTQNKSLIFYAFDLDRQPGVKNASAFQVWGQRDADLGDKPHATNLGILYMDSESNRRWVLRLDDPKQLAEIDAVFVTVEPHGGSQKPTGKPFLYALLRKEANHP